MVEMTFTGEPVVLVGQGEDGAATLEMRVHRSSDPSWIERENSRVRRHILRKSPVPLPVIPAYPERQMTAQQTVLTVIGDLESCLTPDDPALTGSDVGFRAIKCLPAWRADALRSLRSMGITEASLFPTLDGVGREARMLLQESTIPARLQFESMWLRLADDPRRDSDDPWP